MNLASQFPSQNDSAALLYETFRDSAPDRATPSDHTMGLRNFLRYIGRLDPKTGEPLAIGDRSINCKKFSLEQVALIQKAYDQGYVVRVLGAYRGHIGHLLTRHERKQIGEPSQCTRPGKPFNCLRTLAVMTELVAPDECGHHRPELWMLVFPSPQYVDQVAELVQAILDDFALEHQDKQVRSERSSIVSTRHYPQLEQSLSAWSGFEDSLAAFVRHGDVVVIGNVELLLPGLNAVGFSAKFSDWQPFGLDNLFGVQIAVNRSSFSRIVLIGVRECFWGEASARYVEALLRVGARHILYGSKAASMNSPHDINGVRSPGSFSIYSRSRSNQGLTQLNSTITDNEALKHLAELAKIETVGIGVTVPTVIGENKDQRTKLNNLNPSTMDDEDGHIARVVQDYNLLMDGGDESVAFLPVHFISDYIHRDGETAHPNQANLAVTDPGARDPAFHQIGSFFGVYATIFGLREYAPMPQAVTQTSNIGASVQRRIRSVTHLLNAGMVREAVFAIAGSERTDGLPPSSLQAITLICQKYGFLDDAVYMISVLRQRDVWRKLSREDRIRVEVMQIKVHSQSGRFSEVKASGEALLAEYGMDGVAGSEMAASVFRRLALASAKSGDWEEAQDLLDQARSMTSPTDTLHANATNDVFRHIAQLSRHAPSMTDTQWRVSLASARSNYYHAAKGAPVWQANPDKSAIAALFVEAALHLDAKDLDDPSGICRLYAAHLLNIRVGGTERSEGYGELIAFLDDSSTKDLFRRAMRMDGIGRRAFQRVPHSMYLLSEVQQVLEIFRYPILKRGDCLNKLLDRLDPGV